MQACRRDGIVSDARPFHQVGFHPVQTANPEYFCAGVLFEQFFMNGERGIHSAAGLRPRKSSNALYSLRLG